MGMFWRMFESRERRNLVFLLGGMLVTAAFQTVGVGAILPFVSAIANPATSGSGRYYGAISGLIGSSDPSAVLVAFGIAVIILLVGGNAFSGFTQYAIIRFSRMRQYRFEVRLFREYLRRPYAFFVAVNSSELSRNILNEAARAVNLVLVPLLTGLTNASIALFIVVFLLTVNPLVALAVGGVLGGGYGLVYLVIRIQMVRLGRERLAANRVLFQSCNEAFSAIKEVKITHAEDVMSRSFERSALQFSIREAANAMANNLPRYALESLAFGGVVAMLLILIKGSSGFVSGMPLITMYVFAGYKLMPALQAVFRGVSQARYGVSTIETLHSDLTRGNGVTERETEIDRTDDAQPSIDLEEVAFSFDGRKTPAVAGISLHVEAYSTVGFVGETGSGKTTLVDLILGLLEPQSGTISIGGKALSPKDYQSWHERIGYVPQSIALLDAPVSQNIAFGVPEEKIDLDRVRWAAKMAMLDEFVMAELPERYNTEIGERGVRISGGQRQRIGVARALYRDPDVLVLDEATSALDAKTETQVMDSIRSISKRKTIIIIAHRISTVRECDAIYLLESGRIADNGTYDELLARSPAFAALAR